MTVKSHLDWSNQRKVIQKTNLGNQKKHPVCCSVTFIFSFKNINPAHVIQEYFPLRNCTVYRDVRCCKKLITDSNVNSRSFPKLQSALCFLWILYHVISLCFCLFACFILLIFNNYFTCKIYWRRQTVQLEPPTSQWEFPSSVYLRQIDHVGFEKWKRPWDLSRLCIPELVDSWVDEVAMALAYEMVILREIVAKGLIGRSKRIIILSIKLQITAS